MTAQQRTYSRTSRARYGEQTLRGEQYEEEIFVSLRDPDDFEGAYAEFSIRWYPLSSDGPTPRIECFSESVGFLLSCADLLAAMRDLPAKAPAPDEVEATMKGLSFVDEHPPC